MLPLHDLMWQGQDCFVVGGGPSLKNFDWERLLGKNVIATNMAFRVLPKAQILFARDKRWMVTFSRHPGYRSHLGTKVYHRVEPGEFPEVDYNLGENKHWGFHLHEGLLWCRNTGLAAVNLADILGADNIYLLGFDMKGVNGESANWHAEYRDTWRHPADKYQVYVDEFVKCRRIWRARVYNCCVNGGLAPYLRTKDIDEVLP